MPTYPAWEIAATTAPTSIGRKSLTTLLLGHCGLGLLLEATMPGRYSDVTASCVVLLALRP
jgi:hypothetical protein